MVGWGDVYGCGYYECGLRLYDETIQSIWIGGVSGGGEVVGEGGDQGGVQEGDGEGRSGDGACVRGEGSKVTFVKGKGWVCV